MLKVLEAKLKFCVGETSEDFESRYDTNLREMETQCRDLLIEEHYKKFCLMGSFWEGIVGVNVDFNWLFKVRTHLDKTEKE